MLREAYEIAYCATLIRGIFRKETYTKAEEIGEVISSGIKNDFLRGFVDGYSSMSALPIVLPFEGIRGFWKDGKWIAKKVGGALKRTPKATVDYYDRFEVERLRRQSVAAANRAAV